MTEAELARRICGEINKNLNGEAYNLQGGLMTAQSGQKIHNSPHWPDWFIQHKYFTGFVEFKGPLTVITKGQKRKILRLQRTIPALIVRFMDVWDFKIENIALTGEVYELDRLKIEEGDTIAARELLKKLQECWDELQKTC